MSLLSRVSPNYFAKHSTKRIMGELTLGLMVVFVASTVWMGINQGINVAFHAVLMMVSAVITALTVETIYARLRKLNIITTLSNSFGWITAIIIVLMCRVDVDLFAIAVGTAVSLVFAKLLFGGFGHNTFNPAAVGRALIMLTLSAHVVSSFGTIISSATPAGTMNTYNWVISNSAQLESVVAEFGGIANLVFGFHQAAIGEMNSLILLLVGAYLIVRDVIDWRVPLFYIGTVVVIAGGVALFRGMDARYILIHVFSGGLLFGAIFMATDPVTNPTSASGRVYFSIGCGILTMVIRLFANLPEGVLFSILIMNGLSPLIESLTDGYVVKTQKRHVITLVSVVVLAIAGLGFASKSIAAVTDEEEKPGETNTLVIADETGEAEVDPAESIVSGDIHTVVVRAAGYHAINDGGKPNKFEVIIDMASKTITGVSVTVFNDTDGIGSKIEETAFLDQFIGLSIEDSNAGVDVASGATVSSHSAVAAVRAAINYVLGNEDTGSSSSEKLIISEAAGQAEADAAESSVAGSVYTVVVRANGYHANNDGGKPNKFEIVIDADTKTITSVKVTVFNDTAGIGDKIEDTEFLDQFAGLSIEDGNAGVDAASGATESSNSAVAAVKAAIAYVLEQVD